MLPHHTHLQKSPWTTLFNKNVKGTGATYEEPAQTRLSANYCLCRKCAKDNNEKKKKFYLRLAK